MEGASAPAEGRHYALGMTHHEVVSKVTEQRFTGARVRLYPADNAALLVLHGDVMNSVVLRNISTSAEVDELQSLLLLAYSLLSSFSRKSLSPGS